jgi:hypothetical protein
MHASGGNMSPAVDIRSEDFLDRPVECQAALRANAPACVGVGLARIESVIALQVLVHQVDRIVPSEPAGRCTRSYVIRGPLQMRATVHRRAGR